MGLQLVAVFDGGFRTPLFVRRLMWGLIAVFDSEWWGIVSLKMMRGEYMMPSQTAPTVFDTLGPPDV
ncbi:MAG: hypothetical protein Q4C34_05075 [Bacteroidales bacterium]|nr:hypothetical protein [Bacteroidales bacterium]